jgi:hypothetical protein
MGRIIEIGQLVQYSVKEADPCIFDAGVNSPVHLGLGAQINERGIHRVLVCVLLLVRDFRH